MSQKSMKSYSGKYLARKKYWVVELSPDRLNNERVKCSYVSNVSNDASASKTVQPSEEFSVQFLIPGNLRLLVVDWSQSEYYYSYSLYPYHNDIYVTWPHY